MYWILRKNLGLKPAGSRPSLVVDNPEGNLPDDGACQREQHYKGWRWYQPCKQFVYAWLRTLGEPCRMNDVLKGIWN